MNQQKGRMKIVLAVVVGLVMTLTGCGGKANMTDTGGMAQAEVEKLSLERQYALLSERFARMQELLTEAQLQISDGAWHWHDIGTINAGNYAPESLPGSTTENSYYLETARSISPDNARGEIADLDPMLAHFENNDWQSIVSSDDSGSVSHQASALTDDGWHIRYTVRENGNYSVEVVSNMFWGAHRELQAAKSDRMVDYGPDTSVPGVFPRFPKWSDPVVAQ